VTIARSEVHSNRTSPQWQPPVNVLFSNDMAPLPKSQDAIVAALSGKFAALGTDQASWSTRVPCPGGSGGGGGG
jgi:hypothetical protein